MSIICLCGSTRFENEFKRANYELSRMGHIVLSLSAGPSERPIPTADLDPVDKIIFDLTYFEKIRMADVVLVLDGPLEAWTDNGYDRRSGYIGFSTAREIMWATMHGRQVLSLLSLSSWFDVGYAIEHRYEDHVIAAHHWLIDHAHHRLRQLEGQQVVAEQVHDTAKSIMHAGLSVMACQTGTAATFAEAVLLGAGMDPMDDVETALAGTGVYIPDAWRNLPNGTTINIDDGQTRLHPADFVGTAQELAESTVSVNHGQIERWHADVIQVIEALGHKGNRQYSRGLLDMLAQSLKAMIS